MLFVSSPVQDGIQRKAQVANQHQMRDIPSIPFVAVGEKVRGQSGGHDDILGAHVLNFGFGGFRRWGVVSGLRQACHDARDALVVTKDRHPLLRALALE